MPAVADEPTTQAPELARLAEIERRYHRLEFRLSTVLFVFVCYLIARIVGAAI